MENPWKKLANSAPFVLESDKSWIDKFQLIAKAEHKLKTHLMPIPFIGNYRAPVVLLNLNPGYHKNDDEFQATAKFKKVSRSCLMHTLNEYPFYFLDQELEGLNGAGYNWWARRTLSQLLKVFRPEILSQQLFCIEYFPYRSVCFRHSRTIVESQHYGFHLVRQAINRKAMIILMRSKKLWFEAVPELEKYPNLFMVKNLRNPAITARNLPSGIFDQIVGVIESA